MNKLNKKIFGTLFFSIFAAVTGVGIVVPLLPIYAHDLGASGFYIGLIFGAFSLSRTFFLPYFGRLSDLKGRKPFIVPGFLAYALISVAFVYSNSVDSLIVIRFFHGIASAMLMPVIQAYIGDITPKGREGITMGMFNMSLFLGLSLGPVIGGILKDHFSLQSSFFCMGLLALIGFFLSLFLLPPTTSERAIRHGKNPFSWKMLLNDRHVVGLFLFRFAYLVCVGIIWGFIPLLADMEFAASSSLIGVLVMLGVFISGLIHVPMGYLADRISKKLMVTAGGLMISYAIFSFEWADRIEDSGDSLCYIRSRRRDFHAGPDGDDRTKRKQDQCHGQYHGADDGGPQSGNVMRRAGRGINDGFLSTALGLSSGCGRYDDLYRLFSGQHVSPKTTN